MLTSQPAFLRRLRAALSFSLLLTALLPAQTRPAAPRPRQILRPLATTSSSCVTYTAILFNWSYTPNVAACVPNSTLQSCYNGFTAMDTTSNVTIGTPATLGPTATTLTYAPAGGLFLGTHNFSLVTNGYDSNGNAIASTPAVVSVTNSIVCLNPPSGFTAVLQ